MAVTISITDLQLTTILGKSTVKTTDPNTNVVTETAPADVVRLLDVASTLVLRVAGEDTPTAIADEAVIRSAGWLARSQVFGVYESKRGEREFTNSGQPGGLSALRHSGALALLRPWRQLGIAVCE